MKKRFFLALSGVILLTVLLLLPQLKVPWRLIDDGESLRMAQEIGDRFASGDYSWLLSYEKENGRFRPVYWLWHFINFKLFGFSSFGHHLGHLILYVFICILLFLTAYKISQSSLAGFLTVVFFLFFEKKAENYYRLGTAEPLLLFFYLLIAFWLVRIYLFRFKDGVSKRKILDYLLLFVFLAFAYFTKETASVLLIAYFPLFLVGLIDKSIKNEKSWIIFSVFFIFANIFFLALTFGLRKYYGISGGYMAYYEPNLMAIFKRFLIYLRIIIKEYQWALVVPVATFSFSILDRFQKSRKRFQVFLVNLPSVVLWQGVFLLWFSIFLAVQSPWFFVLGRYLSPVICWLAVFLGIEYAQIFVFGVSGKRSGEFTFKFLVLKLTAFIIIFWLVVSQGQKINLMYQTVLRNENYNQNLIKYLAQETPPAGRVYANFSEGLEEYLYELPLHFRFFYHRSDIEVDSLSLNKFNIFQKGEFVISFRRNESWCYSEKEIKKILKKTKEVEKESFGPFWSLLVFEEKEILMPN